MTYQTPDPIKHESLSPSARAVSDLITFFNDGQLTVDTPYQRQPVWTTEQRMMLIKSLLAGTPIPALIINERDWTAVDEPYYAVIDGKQRILALAAWFADELAVPASWFLPEHVEKTIATDDGPYVTRRCLSVVGDRLFRNLAIVPVASARVRTVAEEAEIYLRVNGGGTAQSADDMANAQRVAESGA